MRHGAFAAMSAVAAVLASVTLPATATAATVFTREADLNGELVPWTFFEAAPGEANRVTATAVADFSAARWVEAGALWSSCRSAQRPSALRSAQARPSRSISAIAPTSLRSCCRTLKCSC